MDQKLQAGLRPAALRIYRRALTTLLIGRRALVRRRNGEGPEAQATQPYTEEAFVSEALEALIAPGSVALFEKYGVLSARGVL